MHLYDAHARTRGSGPLFSAGEEGIPGAFFISDGAKICRCWDGSRSTLINTTAHHHLEPNRSRLKVFLRGPWKACTSRCVCVCVWHTPISFSVDTQQTTRDPGNNLRCQNVQDMNRRREEGSQATENGHSI